MILIYSLEHKYTFDTILKKKAQLTLLQCSSLVVSGIWKELIFKGRARGGNQNQ